MSVLNRLVSKMKAGLDALLTPAEDPRLTFADAYKRQRALLVNVRQTLSEVAASKDRLEVKTAEVRRKLPQLEGRARGALIDGQEHLATLALQRHQVATMELEALEERIREAQREEERLSIIEQRLTAQIEASFARQDLIAARYSAAETQVRVKEALSGVSQEIADLGLALEQAEQEAEHMQARASAIDQLVEAVTVEGFDLPSAPDLAPAVRDQLEALKREIREGELPVDET